MSATEEDISRPFEKLELIAAILLGLAAILHLANLFDNQAHNRCVIKNMSVAKISI